MIPVLRQSLSALRVPLFVAALYLVLHAVFGAVTERGGLLTPGGSVSLGVAVLGVVILVLRIFVLFVVPAMIVHRLVSVVIRPREK